MPIITLTTDLGDSDYFVGALKGYILSQVPEVTITDISHNIRLYDIVQAALALRHASVRFPPGTVHLGSVQAEGQSRKRDLLTISNGQSYIAPDNGLLSLVVDKPEAIYTLKPAVENTTFPALDNLAPVACQLLRGVSPSELGDAVQGFEQVHTLQPDIGPDYLRSNVVHIDHFGNVILNVSKSMFEEVKGDRAFLLQLRRNHSVDRIGMRYDEVPVGELNCLFNSMGLLEISVNHGRANSLFGLNQGDSVRIDFQ